MTLVREGERRAVNYFFYQFDFKFYSQLQLIYLSFDIIYSIANQFEHIKLSFSICTEARAKEETVGENGPFLLGSVTESH